MEKGLGIQTRSSFIILAFRMGEGLIKAEGGGKTARKYKRLQGEGEMKFYFQTADGTRREMTIDEVREHMSTYQIGEAIAAKKADPMEEVSYMTVGGFIVVDFN